MRHGSCFAVLCLILLVLGGFSASASEGARRDIDTEVNKQDMPDSLTRPKIVVRKEERKLQLYDGDTLLREYAIGLGENPSGHKKREGDSRTPEGEYYVCSRNDESKYYLSFGISYPNAQDAETGLRAGYIDEEEYDAILEAIEDGKRPPWGTALGGEIMIHGNGGGSDWTAGCIAIEDDEMDALWDVVEIGCPVTILP